MHAGIIPRTFKIEYKCPQSFLYSKKSPEVGAAGRVFFFKSLRGVSRLAKTAFASINLLNLSIYKNIV